MTDLATIEASWDRAAREDAMFNIITEPGRQNGGWTVEEFLAHGRREIDAAMQHLRGLDVPVGGYALDFGCGIGRLSVALADHFERVVGVDISAEMIARAVPHKRVRYLQRDDLDDVGRSRFDLVYSMVVLQHMPQDLQRGYVRQFFRHLRTAGVAMFQIPEGPDSGHSGWHLSMFGTPQATVEDWIDEAGGNLINIEDLGVDSEWRSLRYTAVAS